MWGLNAPLLALKMEEDTMSQGMQRALELEKARQMGLLEQPEGTKPY